MSHEQNEVRPRRGLYDFLKFALIAFLIVTPFRFFVAQPFIVSGASMEPALEEGEYLVIDELTYRFREPQRGDVVIFLYPLDTDIFLIKRVIGLPGETIEIRDGAVFVRREGGETTILHEPYIASSAEEKSTTVQLAGGEYFVLGDNRNASADSRRWGPLQERYIIGRALLRLLPFDKATLFPGRYTFGAEE